MMASLVQIVKGQGCSTLGQTPVTSFPVCGSSIFHQDTVPICLNNSVPAGSCGSYPDTNPFWYKFTCFTSGTLGFLITPVNLDDDYDWSLFDVTNRDPMAVYDSSSFLVSYNWSGNTSVEKARGYTGITGTAPSGTQDFACSTNPKELGGSPPYSDASTINKMPQIIQGHTYLLLVSHYTQTQSGYGLNFSGGTASITDPGLPSLQSAVAQCDGSTISVKLSKHVKCNSLAPDGSDFMVTPALSGVLSVTGINCTNGFDLDSLVVILKNPLPPGHYNLVMMNGSDGNSLLDDCNNNIPAGDQLPFEVKPVQPTPLDSITALGCAPASLELVFSKPINCSTIAADGSDFTITGPSSVPITSATGTDCVNGFTSRININLVSPITTGGTYQITLKTGSDGNTLTDLCSQQTPAGSSLAFSARDTVYAGFNYQIQEGCNKDSILLSGTNPNGITTWQWTFDSSAKSADPKPLFIETQPGFTSIRLRVSNGVCSDSSSATFTLDNVFKAALSGPDTICPKDQVIFQNNSIGNIQSWYWDFGDGSSSSDKNPLPHQYPPTSSGASYQVRLVANYGNGCFDTASIHVNKLRTCAIDVPTAFTPNGDGHNDFLYPLNAFKAVNLEFRVYNRFGQMVFETKDWTRKWDGTINGKPQDTGTYVWTLQYTDRDSGHRYFLKGTSVLIR